MALSVFEDKVAVTERAALGRTGEAMGGTRLAVVFLVYERPWGTGRNTVVIIDLTKYGSY